MVMKNSRVLITGINGQDGSYLAEDLLKEGHEIHGTIRRSSVNNLWRIESIKDDIKLHYIDLSQPVEIKTLLDDIKPDYIYNLAAQSHVAISFEQPLYTTCVDGNAVLVMLEWIRRHPDTNFYQASTSELYGNSLREYQDEETPMNPVSPYGVAKLMAHHAVRVYRESYGIFACAGILFNHESERRGDNFVTQKIAKGTVKALYTNEPLILGNLDAKRDWGYAPDYVKAMNLMMNYDEPLDFVISTGETHSIREFVELAFRHCGLEIEWKGDGLNEVGVVKDTGNVKVRVSDKYYRLNELEALCGQSGWARNVLGWSPENSFEDIVKIMVDNARRIP